jgi:hypothetical protein
VDYAVSYGGEPEGLISTPVDFDGHELPSGTITFAADETTKQITIVLAGDEYDEDATEDFSVAISNLSDAGATITTATATQTVTDDDDGSKKIYIDGSVEDDNLTYSTSSAMLTLHAFTAHGDLGSDTLDIDFQNQVNAGNAINIAGNDGDDTLDIDFRNKINGMNAISIAGNDGDDIIELQVWGETVVGTNQITIQGNSGSDDMKLYLTGIISGVGANSVSMNGGSGNDTMLYSANAKEIVNDSVYMRGGTGVDNLIMNMSANGSDLTDVTAALYGGYGNDNIVASFQLGNENTKTISGNFSLYGSSGRSGSAASADGNDTLTLNIHAGASGNVIDAGIYMYGDDNSSEASYPLVGIDKLKVSVTGYAVTSNVVDMSGLYGNDQITVAINAGYLSGNTLSIAGNSGNDKISVSVIASTIGSTENSNAFKIFGNDGIDTMTLKFGWGGTFASNQVTMKGSDDDDNMKLYLSPDGGSMTSNVMKMYGGSGSDTMLVSYKSGSDHMSSNTISMYGGSGDDKLTMKIDLMKSSAGSMESSAVHLYGSSDSDELKLTVSAHKLNSAGYFTLSGGDGNDLLSLNLVANSFSGGSNYFYYYGGGGNDVINAYISNPVGNLGHVNISLSGSSGDDQIFFSAKLGADGQSMTGSSCFSLGGGSGNDLITASLLAGSAGIINGASLSLYGRNGDDTLLAKVTAKEIYSHEVLVSAGSGKDVASMNITAETIGKIINNVTTEDRNSFKARAGYSSSGFYSNTLKIALDGTNIISNIINFSAHTASVLMKFTVSQPGTGVASNNNVRFNCGKGNDTISLNYADANGKSTGFQHTFTVYKPDWITNHQINGLTANMDFVFAFESRSFAGVGDYTISADRFHLGTTAAATDDYYIYDAAAKKLYFDQDGSDTTIAKKTVATFEHDVQMTTANITHMDF